MASAMLLASCGGGSSSIASSETPASENPDSTQPISEVSEVPAQPISEVPEVPASSEEYDPSVDAITIARAIELATAAGENGTAERYIIGGTIQSITKYAFGEMTIADETGEIYVYGVYSEDGSLFFDQLEDRPEVGDFIYISCILNTYKGTPQVKNGRLLKVIHAIDDRVFEKKTIAEARLEPADSLLELKGVVAKITYANGKVPNGFYLVDSSGSIYVYSPGVALDVAEGNEVTIQGTKTYYILDSEKENAAKFGYQGSCQIQDAKLVENDQGSHEFDKSWIQESTVKEMMELPLSDNQTTNIYKVNAYLEKRPGSGFVNYYFFDLDQKTGSYVYTLCNGSDFSYLDEFDGKIVTAYLSILNAKASGTGTNYRLIPIEVIDEGYVFDVSKAAEFAVKYYGVGQFIESYSADPAALLVDSVSSELLGIEDVPLSYASDNTDAVYFEQTEDGTVFHVGTPGSAKITVSSTYQGVAYSEELNVTVTEPELPESLTVAEAIATEDETEVTVRGIIASSLVVQSGFILIDESGIIAVRMADQSDLAALSLGDEVIVKGTRTHYKPATNIVGQTCINDATIVADLYGDHDYSTASFGSATVEDIYGFVASEDHTAEAYTLTAQLIKKSSAYSTNYYVTDGTYELFLYASSGSQYSWLDPYLNTDIEMELVPCNWNNKSYYRVMLIAIHPEGQDKIVNDLYFRG